MPTAGRLFAALAFALVGLFAAWAFRPLMPPTTEFGSFVPISVVLGAICGWKVLGPRAGRGWRLAIGAGLSTSVVLLVVALILFSGREMLLRALRGRYDGPMDATVATFGVVLEYLSLMGDLRFLGVLVLGGILGGLLAETGQRIWR